MGGEDSIGGGTAYDGLESNVEDEATLRIVLAESFACAEILKSRGVNKSVGIGTGGTAALAVFVVCTGRRGVVTGLVKYDGSVFYRKGLDIMQAEGHTSPHID